MSEKKPLAIDKKTLSTVLVGAEIVLILVLVTISLMTMFWDFGTDVPTSGIPLMIWWFRLHLPWMFIIVVLPLIVLFLLNVYFMVRTLYLDKKNKPATLSAEELVAEAKRQAREELLKELEEEKKKAK